MLSACGSRLLNGTGGSSPSSSGGSTSGGRHASRTELLAGASTSSNSSEPLDDAAQQSDQWHQHKQNDEFFTLNGAIFALTSGQQQQLAATANVNLAGAVHQHQSKTSRQRHEESLVHHQPAPLPNTKSARLEHGSGGQPRPLNRHQHYRPIHQQLQRIYGNKLQEFEQINRQQKQATQTAPIGKRDSTGQNPPPPPPVGMQTEQSEQHVFVLDGHLQRPYNHHHHNHHHPHLHSSHLEQTSVAYHQQDSQTYDSLIVTEQAMAPPQPPPKTMVVKTTSSHFGQARQMAPRAQHQPYQQDLYDFNPRPLMRPGPPPVPAENTRRHAIESVEYDANNNVIMETDGPEAFEMDEAQEREVEEEEEGDQQNLLMEDARQIARQSSQLLIDSRKRQMESLHYATATAAALLNVTASAAAAFAVSDKNLVDRARQPQPQQPRQRAATQQAERRPQAIQTSSNATGTKLANCSSARHSDQYQQLYEFGQDHSKQSGALQQQQLKHQAPSSRNQAQQSRPSVRDHRQAIYQVNADQNGLRYQQQRANLMFNRNHQQQLPAPVRPLQPARKQDGPQPGGAVPMTGQQLDLLRRYRQQIQLQSNAVGLGHKANVYNNIHQVVPAALALAANGVPTMAMLQARDKQIKHGQQQQTSVAVKTVDPRLLLLSSGQQQSSHALAKLQNELSRQVTYGLLVPSKGNKKLNQSIYAPYPLQMKSQLEQQALARQSHYQLGAITSNSSETSNRSNVPLILNRAIVKPAKSGLVDKISHINLTIFWWILLAVCVIFIAAVISITRYLM